MVMLVVILVQYFGRGGVVLPENPRELAELELRAKQMKADAYVEKNWRDCWAALANFLSATTTEERTQFVRDPRRVAGTMS
ncbi:MAG: hypothetical protein GWO24_33030, partial [Akkermansiaceae bacterium]|nr:hypothetical protein [Akkermansiaceae bacterium]